MLQKEKKELLRKLTIGVGKLLIKVSENWTDREISEVSKVPPNRLTEYKNYEKYKRSITMDNLIMLSSGGVFSVNEIIDASPKLSKAEERYFREEMDIALNAVFRKKVRDNKRSGIDPVEAQTLMQELMAGGVNPIELMKSAKDKL